LRALRDVGIRTRFSYGYSRNLQQKRTETADFNDIARVKREWFGPSNDGLLTMGFASRGPGDTPLDGAKDLGIADRVGSLAPGKRADLILVRTNDLNVAPFGNPALLLVQQAQPHNVDTVIIDGRILKHTGELVALDTEEIVRKAAESFHEARKRAGGPY
jgi:cytosine/adenosine deaminase-related metal-dependent hydrolase